MIAQLGLAFLAGLASFLSPCVLPLVPVYLAYLTGSSFEELKSKTPKRLVLLHALLFVLGFTIVFVILGASASFLGRLFLAYRYVIETAGGILLIVFGVWMLGLLKIGFLYKEARFRFHDRPAGFAGSVLVGGAFAVGWTPCVGPILAGILVLAGREGAVLKGIVLLSAYSLGLAVPFLLFALAVERASRWLKKLGPWLPWLEKGMGAVLVLLGVLLVTGEFGRQTTKLLSLFPGWARFFGKLGL